MTKPMLKLLGGVFTSALMLGTSQAGTALFDFDSDPSANGELTVLHRGGASGGLWYPTEGAPSDPNGTNGYFSITDASGSQRCTVIFGDFDAGLVVKAFTIGMDIRVGGSGAAQPADGFTINYARANDPVLVNNDGSGYASNPSNSEADLEEEGTTTGLSVAFDSFLNGIGDVIGITIRLDNNIITNIPMGLANGGCTNLTSIQTGDAEAVVPTDLCWTKLVVQLTTNGLLNLSYKDRVFLTNFPTSYGPSAGRLILSGRTGANSQFAHVDNIAITTIPTTGPAVGSAIGNLTGFSLGIDDSGPATPNTNTLNVELDGTLIISHGTNVSPGTVTVGKTGITTSITYQQAAIFASGSLHTVHVTFSGTGFTGVADETRSFVVGNYATLPLSLRTPLGSGDSAKPGFRVKVWQIDNQFSFINGWQNQALFVEQQLAGLIGTNTIIGERGTNVADLTSFTNSNSEFYTADPVNYSNAGDQGTVPGDLSLPGLPGFFGNTDDAVYEFVTYVEFPTNGLYTFGVQSDDGFKVTVGDRPSPDIGLTVLAPASAAGRYFAAPTALDYGQAFGGILPTGAPLVAQAVVCDPPWPTELPANAAALAGRIAILHRDATGGVYAHALWAQVAGAIAVVVVDQDDLGSTGRLPGPWGGGSSDFTIPLVTVEYVAGTNLLAIATTNTASPVVLSLADDSSQRLGGFDGGRGATSPTVFNVLVTQPGLYPLRLLYENGGGGASVEWWTISGGTTNLINDPVSGLKAFRARSITTGPAHLNPPTLSGSNVIVSWTGLGELEVATAITGPWQKSVYQTSPATVPFNTLVGPARFFRIRQY